MDSRGTHFAHCKEAFPAIEQTIIPRVIFHVDERTVIVGQRRRDGQNRKVKN